MLVMPSRIIPSRKKPTTTMTPASMIPPAIVSIKTAVSISQALPKLLRDGHCRRCCVLVTRAVARRTLCSAAAVLPRQARDDIAFAEHASTGRDRNSSNTRACVGLPRY
jgi:hypothetical protein